MDGRIAFIANPKAPEVVQVRKAALDHPALGSQPRAMLGPASGDDGCDATGSQQASVGVEVIAAIGQDSVGSAAGPSAPTPDRSGMQVIQQRDQLGDVVAIAGRERDGKGDTRPIDQQMVLGAHPGAINRRWPGQEPPKSARIWEPSTLARDQSIAPAALSLTRRRWCKASHMPAACQSRSRRQHVTPDP